MMPSSKLLKALSFVALLSTALNAEFIRDASTQMVQDTTKHLIWIDNETAITSLMTWSNGMSYCSDLVYGGYSDWRLPTLSDLESIVDTQMEPKIKSAFLNSVADTYWTSDIVLEATANAWFVDFRDGTSDWNSRTYQQNIRCVKTDYGSAWPTSSSSSVSSSSSSASFECPSGFSFDAETGYCIVSASSSSMSSSSSSSISSSSSSVVSYLKTESMPISIGWNLISIPFGTEQEINLNTLLQGKATIAWKFSTSSTGEYAWSKWNVGDENITLKNGEGLFVGVATGNGALLEFTANTWSGYEKFDSQVFIKNTWYLLGYPYTTTVGSIKALYPNSVIWVMENGDYKKLDNNTTIIPAGTGFWFKDKE